eukprot:scaffold22.g6066.t1
MASKSTLLTRIKRMMQQDEDVGKVAKASPVLIAKALDMFVQRLVEGGLEVAQGRGAKTLTASHIKAHVESDQLLDFVRELVANVPDLPPPGEVKSPRAKRPRPAAKAEAAGEEGGEPGAKAPGARARARGQGAHSGGGGGGRARGKSKRAAPQDSDDDAGMADVEQRAEPHATRRAAAAAAEAGPGAAAAAGGAAQGRPEQQQQQQAEQQQQQSPEQQQEQQEQQEQRELETPAAGAPQQPPPPPQGQVAGPAEGEAAAPAEGEAAAPAEGEAAVPVVTVPAFLAAAAVGQGAEAEEEDYDA